MLIYHYKYLDMAFSLELVVDDQPMVLVGAELQGNVERVPPRVAAQLRVRTFFQERHRNYYWLLSTKKRNETDYIFIKFIIILKLWRISKFFGKTRPFLM